MITAVLVAVTAYSTGRDGMGDDPGDSPRLMTYAEIAQERGITKASAKKLAVRNGWRRQAGNDGLARVWVPGTVPVPAASRNASVPPDVPGDDPGDNSSILKALQEHVDTLRAQLSRAEAMLDQAKAEAGEARGEAAEAHSMMRGLMDTIMRLQARLEAAEAEAKGAVETLQRVQARGLWKRMLGR